MTTFSDHFSRGVRESQLQRHVEVPIRPVLGRLRRHAREHTEAGRRELSNEYLLAKIGIDTAENEPLEVWGKIQFIIHSPP